MSEIEEDNTLPFVEEDEVDIATHPEVETLKTKVDVVTERVDTIDKKVSGMETKMGSTVPEPQSSPAKPDTNFIDFM